MVKISSVALDSNRNLTPSNQDRTDKRTLSALDHVCQQMVLFVSNQDRTDIRTKIIFDHEPDHPQ